ncbi:dipeptide epimerase [Legionella waltersii]|uniref:Dipeptide epimerase n=1 Tax=Legionella waltersii TaxID=66969 RepID=A0A0W1A4H9_9GAMM|nr:dipeptide epimerase [Legionella waltersii]KTD76274.1 chloromuconate cycloisomerase [Legionella waltersii]SNV13343.1 chloromuconate cycloisomerase [Legionella waltersii]
MYITEIQLAQLIIPLKRPFITAVRRTESVNDVVVMIKTNNGCVGYGSAASTPAITGDTIESIINSIRTTLGPPLIGRSICELNQLLEMNQNGLKGNTSAKAAIDMALHDLFAQYCGLPLYQLLGGNNNKISSCITISVKSPEEMVEEAMELVKYGHNLLKVKLGLEPSEDLKRIQTIRQKIGYDITLLVDANQGWLYSDALRLITAFENEALNIPMVEQPIKAKDLKHLKLISQQAKCLIIADESCFSSQDALNIAQNSTCDGVNIKLMKSGGIAQAQAIYHIAKTADMQIMVGCMLESPIGVAAIASFAVSKPDITYADLDPIYLIQDNYVLGGAQIHGTDIILADKPGLGISGFSDGLQPIGVIE